MGLRQRIDELNSLEKQLYYDTAVNLAIAGVGYACDWKLVLYLSGSCVLFDCYNGISINKERSELIRRLKVEEKFGGKK